MTRAKFFYLIFVVHLKIPFQIIPDLVSEDQDTVRGCDFLRGALPMIRDPPSKAEAKGHVSGGAPDTPAPEGSAQLSRPGCRLRCWVLAQSGVARGRSIYDRGVGLGTRGRGAAGCAPSSPGCPQPETPGSPAEGRPEGTPDRAIVGVALGQRRTSAHQLLARFRAPSTASSAPS